MSTRTFALTLALALAAPAALHAQQVELKTADQKALYAIGTGEARTLQDLNVTPEESKKFVAAAAKEKGAKKLEGGVVFLELKAGEGAQAKDTDRVRILYKGTLRNGTPFDAVLDPSKAAEFDLGLMIPCWQQAIAQM